MEMMGKRRILLGVVLVILISLAIGCSNDVQVKKLDCDSKTGLERDQCLSFLALQSLNKTMCAELQDNLVRDVCYLHVIVSNPIGEDDCLLIGDPLLQYHCVRLYPRPLLSTYFSERSLSNEISIGTSFENCSLFDDYHAAICTSLKAASLASTSVQEAESICAQVGSERLAEECRFFIASALAKNSGDYAAEEVAVIMGECRGISHPLLKSMCYSVLTDELARMRPRAPVEELALVYNGLPIGADYYSGGYNLISLLLPESQRGEFCSLLNGSRREFCFGSLARLIAEEVGYDATLGMEQCEGFPPEFQEMCHRAIASGFGAGVLEFNLNIALCDEFKGPYREGCFATLGKEIINGFITKDQRNLSAVMAVVDLCGEFPIDVRDGCFFGLGSQIDFVYSTFMAVETCNTVPSEFRDDCFTGLSHQISWEFIDDIPEALTQCREVPVKFRKICRDEIAVAITELVREDISQSVAKCNEFPVLLRKGCFDIVIKDIQEKSGSDITSAIEKCNQLPGKHKEKCLDLLRGDVGVE